MLTLWLNQLKIIIMKAWVIDKISDLNKEQEPLKQVELPKPV